MNTLELNLYLKLMNIDFICFDSLESTNSYLLNKNFFEEKWQVCQTLMQTKGRGRRNNEWKSLEGDHIYCSMSKTLKINAQEISSLSLVCAIIIVEQISLLTDKKISDKLEIKWPNDIWLNGEKIVGILIETNNVRNKTINAVIGFGINISKKKLNDQFASLIGDSNQKLDRNELLKNIIVNISAAVDLFIEHGFGFFQDRYYKYDFLVSKNISFYNSNAQQYGKVKGVNLSGCLQIESDEKITSYNSSDIHTVRIIE